MLKVLPNQMKKPSPETRWFFYSIRYLLIIYLLSVCTSLIGLPPHFQSSPTRYHSLVNFDLNQFRQMANESLKQSVRAKDQLGQLEAFNQLAEFHLANNEADTAVFYFQQALDLSIGLAQDNNMLYFMGALSEALFLVDEVSLAIQWREKYLSKAQDLGRKEEIAWAQKRLGRLFIKNKQIDQAKNHFRFATKSYTDLGQKNRAEALINEWGIYSLRKKKYLMAIHCFTTNLETQTERNDTLGVVSSLKNLIEIYEKLEQIDAVVDYCNQLLLWAQGPNYKIWKSGAHLRLGKIAEKADDIGTAKDHYLQNQQLALTVTEQPELLATIKAKRPVYQAIGDFNLPAPKRQTLKEHRVFPLIIFWIRIGAFQQAEALLKRWLQPNELALLDLRTVRLAYRLKTESLRNQGRLDEAVCQFVQLLKNEELAPVQDPYLDRFQDFQADAQESHQKLLLLFQNQEQEKVIAQHVWQRLSLAAGICFTLLISGFLFYHNRQRRQINVSLSEKNKLIETALDDKEMLIREIHHRVKNNLQVVSSLLNLQARYLNDPDAIGAIKEGRDRVQSMAFIHQKLYQLDEVKQMKVPDYIEELSSSLFNSYQIDVEQIQLETAIDPILLDVDTMIPLGLILNELLSNALKHAFPNGQKGKISINFRKEQDQFLLEVKDTGVGFGASDKNGPSGGFGYHLIRAFTKKIKGQLTVKNIEGSCISLLFSPKQVYA